MMTSLCYLASALIAFGFTWGPAILGLSAIGMAYTDGKARAKRVGITAALSLGVPAAIIVSTHIAHTLTA